MFGWRQVLDFLDVCAVYYTLQLTRCVAFSLALTGVVMLLRSTIFRKRIFAKGMLWALFLLLPFFGKLRLFYENALAVKLSWRFTGAIMAYRWIGRIYMGHVFIGLCCICIKRYWLGRMVARLGPFGRGRSYAGGGNIYITDRNVTPFAVGLCFPKIILPRVMMGRYTKKELEMVIRHERTHIRLGHLWCYLLWDILKCLLWANPFMYICQKYFRADLEHICDKVCIQQGQAPAYEYAALLLKSMRLLRCVQEGFAPAAAYADAGDFKEVKKRMVHIAQFTPYQKARCRCAVCMAALCLLLLLAGIRKISYGRYSEMEGVIVHNNREVLLYDSNELRRAVSYDGQYVYVKSEAFEKLLGASYREPELYIVFGGFEKFPGIGGNADSCLYRNPSKKKAVRIPYEKQADNWLVTLYKLM